MDSAYSPPLALTILSIIFLLLGAICLIIVTADIVWRRGWRSMMAVMVVVYPINAAYMLPVTLYTYFKYGRPSLPSEATGPSCHQPQKQSNCHSSPSAPQESHCHSAKPAVEEKKCHSSSPTEKAGDCCTAKGEDHTPIDSDSDAPTAKDNHCHQSKPAVEKKSGNCCSSPKEEALDSDSEAKPCHQKAVSSPPCHSTQSDAFDPSTEKGEPSVPHCHSTTRPFYITLIAGVSHCGAGCVLGDVVGEFVVWGSGATINGATVWPCLLVDYAFALVFGIAFQYFSIAPMSGDYSLKTVWRAAKADVLSLTSFEVGAFAWMVIFQVGIFDYKLSMVSWTYWWMMQIGMVLGFGTALPMNWFLITRHIKEPCC